MKDREKIEAEKKAADRRITRAFHRVERPLTALIAELAAAEAPTAIDEAEFSETETGVHLEYRARPIGVSFIGEGRKISVRVEPIATTKEKLDG